LSTGTKSQQQHQQEYVSIIDATTTTSSAVADGDGDDDYYCFGSPFLSSTMRLVEEYEDAFASICFCHN
jgi:hypothetical protein